MRTDIESRINEAEVCRSMGLYGDSLSIYEGILAIVPPQDSQTQDKIQKRISLLNKEMYDNEKTKPKKVSAEDISMYKKTFSTEGNVLARGDHLPGFYLVEPACLSRHSGIARLCFIPVRGAIGGVCRWRYYGIVRVLFFPRLWCAFVAWCLRKTTCLANT